MSSRIVAFYPQQKFRETTDVIITQGTKILLIRRGHSPYKGSWALPGGHIDPADVRDVVNKADDKIYWMQLVAEYAKIGALRETEEEVGIKIDPKDIKQVMTVSRDETIDPRGPTLTHVFHYNVTGEIKPKAGDDADDYAWFEIKNLNPKVIAFDHYQIIQDWVHSVAGKQSGSRL